MDINRLYRNFCSVSLRFAVFALLVLAGLSLGAPAFAAFASFGDFFGQVGGFLFPGVIGLGFFMIGKSGYTFLTSEGNPEKVKQAKEELTSAIIGLIFVILSAVILKLIIGNLISEDIFS